MPECIKGTAADIPEIVDLHIHTWQQAYKGFLPASFLSQMDAQKQIKRHQKYFEKQTPYILAKDEAGNLMAFCSYGKSRNPLLTAEWELYTLYVGMDYQGKGIGKLLLEQVFSRISQKDQYIGVTVFGRNPYLSFYTKNGFERIGEEEIAFRSFSEKAINLRRPIA